MKLKDINAPRYFFDMDGTLNPWEWVGPDVWSRPMYFRMRPALKEMVETVKEVARVREVFILSAAIHEQARQEKRGWIREYLPEIDDEHIIFVPYGQAKSDYVPSPRNNDILIDDCTDVLLGNESFKGWHGIGIKADNPGINGTKGRWKGVRINVNESSSVTANILLGVA